MVIDGQIAYTGGVNLADEYINQIERFGYWKDSGLRIDGPAVQAFTRLFLMNWYINRGEISDFDQYHWKSDTIWQRSLYPIWQWTKTDLPDEGG